MSSFLDYLEEHRGLFIDHRLQRPARPAPSAAEAELALATSTADADATPGARRRRRARTAPRVVRYRHVRPAFAPSPYSDPLPYDEPWERALR